MSTRKWLAECHAWLDDPESVQFRSVDGNWITYIDRGVNPFEDAEMEWRIKPKSLSINGREFEQPCTVGMDMGWVVYLRCGDLGGDDQHYFYHATKEARDLHYKILVEESTPK